MSINNTISYYDTQANAFVASTINVKFDTMQNRFLSFLPEGATILDFGCGSGRDTRYFLEQGFCVTATDGSIEMCRLASEYTGIQVRHEYFEELEEIEAYNGIWACASILHVPKVNLSNVFQRMIRALRLGGILYTSFKYGEFEGERDGRYFTDFTIDGFKGFIKGIDNVTIEEYWMTKDARPGREDERWLNLILRKTNS